MELVFIATDSILAPGLLLCLALGVQYDLVWLCGIPGGFMKCLYTAQPSEGQESRTMSQPLGKPRVR